MIGMTETNTVSSRGSRDGSNITLRFNIARVAMRAINAGTGIAVRCLRKYEEVLFILPIPFSFFDHYASSI